MRKIKKENVIIPYEKGYRVTKEGVLINPKGKIVNGFIRNDYYHFTFRIELNKWKACKIHRLQAYQKFGDEIFNENNVIRHLNNNPLDNSWDNIGIGTHSDNMMDMPKDIRLNKALIATSFMKKHNHKAILEDRAKGLSYNDLMKKYKIKSKGTISFIINKSIERP